MLTQEDRWEMKRLRDENPEKWTYVKLGEKFGVCRQRVTVILDPKAYEKQLANYRRWYRRKRDRIKTDSSSGVSISSG